MATSPSSYANLWLKSRGMGSTIPLNRNLGHQIFKMNVQKYHDFTGTTGVTKKSEERETDRESMRSDVSVRGSATSASSSEEVGLQNKVVHASPMLEPMEICLEIGNKDGEGKVEEEEVPATGPPESLKRFKKINLDMDNWKPTAEKNEHLSELKPAIEKNEKSDELKPRNRVPFLSIQRRSFLTKMLGWNDDPNVLTIAVDATPTRGGGLLRLPGREKTIFYYSLDWSDHFEFYGDSTKFEMINAALALELFDPFVKGYRSQYKWFIVKTDSPFFKSAHGFKDRFDAQFLETVLQKVAANDGIFLHTIKSSKDRDIVNADYLSRTILPVGLKEFYGRDDGPGIDYTLIDFSKGVANHILDDMIDFIPSKYLKMYG